MKAVIFAGGVGTRLWPLSRQKSPKQFERIIGKKSTLELTIDRLLPDFSWSDIYISTGQKYLSIIKKQLPLLPEKNIIAEPVKKDVGPAVALVMGLLAKQSPDEPVIILWSDHLVKNKVRFKKIIKAAASQVENDRGGIVFIGQKARFPSINLGWIEFGKEIKKTDDVSFYKFINFKYRPDADTAQKYFTDQRHCWNLGYFVSTPRFIYDQFKRFTPQIYHLTEKIVNSPSQKEYEINIEKEYKNMPVINFDNAIIEQLDPAVAQVINEDIGWSDLGAWEALKNALEEKKEDNITQGRVILDHCIDNLIYNFDDEKTIVAIDLDDFIVVNTQDVLMVTKKSSVGKIKEFVEKLEKSKNNHLI